jgi:hypothetical protein
MLGRESCLVNYLEGITEKTMENRRLPNAGCPILAFFARVGFHGLVWRGHFCQSRPPDLAYTENPHSFAKNAKEWGTLGF